MNRRVTVVLLVAACHRGPDPVPQPLEGELVIHQLGLSSGTIGESALIIGPDGTRVLLDVGNDGHADQVAAAVADLGEAYVDVVLITHAHADHVGALDKLAAGLIDIRGPVVHRGVVDLDDANESENDAAIQHPNAVALCDDTGCPGLPWTLQMGGARLDVFVANGFVATDDGVVDLDVDLSEENARSLAGVLTFGDFQYVFGGDLTGGGKDTPDVESAVAALGLRIPYVQAGQVDLLHLNHHGISSSTSPDWVAWLLGEGRTAHALVGATGAYLDAPSEEALDAVRPHLGDGRVWVTRRGLLGGSDPLVVEANGTVTVRVGPDGQGSLIVPDADPVAIR